MAGPMRQGLAKSPPASSELELTKHQPQLWAARALSATGPGLTFAGICDAGLSLDPFLSS